MPHHLPPPAPLSELRCADSTFLAYVLTSTDPAALESQLAALAASHPYAAHAPHARSLGGGPRHDDGGEPEPAEIGGALSDELRRCRGRLARCDTVRVRGSGNGGRGSALQAMSAAACDGDESSDDCDAGDDDENDGEHCGVPTCVAVVRYFGTRHLGVTCGRLTAVYRRAARVALHRHARGSERPFAEVHGNCRKNVYGLGAGDTELILDVVDGGEATVSCLLRELRFEGMVGGDAAVLPRLQNLQAELPFLGPSESSSGDVVPVYRYPGNYSGTEWPTHPYSPTSLLIKRAVESALRPLYVQSMNHCVTNLYRNGRDDIQHHSDKDLDLNRDGVIVSVSLGSERVMEIRDRRRPNDVSRVVLPAGSMLVLGPHTNAAFTHSILPSDGGVREPRRGEGAPKRGPPTCDVGNGGRISLTFRDVRTYLDARSGRLVGQGAGADDALEVDGDGAVTRESLSRAVEAARDERRRGRRSAGLVALLLGSAAACAAPSRDRVGGRSPAARTGCAALASAAAAGVASYWYLVRLRDGRRRGEEEAEARRFFSRKSASGNSY